MLEQNFEPQDLSVFSSALSSSFNADTFKTDDVLPPTHLIRPDLPIHTVKPHAMRFLLEEGITYEQIAHCVQVATTWQVEPLEALTALNIMDATTLYRAIARHLNCRFITHADEVVCTLPASARITRTGILPVRLRDDAEMQSMQLPTRFAIAPTSKHLTQLSLLIRQKRDGAVLAPDFQNMVITTPAILRTIARAHNPVMIAHMGANELPDHDPTLSIRDGLTHAQKRFIVAFSAFNGVAILLILGSLLLPLSSPLPLINFEFAKRIIAFFYIAEMLILSAFFLMLITLRLAASRQAPSVELPIADAFEIPEYNLPIYTLLIPLYREYQVLPQLLDALRHLNYPAAKLDVKIIVEHGDTLTRDALNASDLPSFVDVVVAPDGKPRTKPRALNIALQEARGEFLVIYDAEDVPDPLQLRHAVHLFSRSSHEVACLQARLVIDNTHDSWLTRFFTIEYCQLFDAFNPMLARLRLPLPLGGTSNHFRTAVLRDVMGWDAWNVTEDADLGFRLMQKGYVIADLPSSTYEEAPSELKSWLYQRTRWLKGWMQVSITHSRHPFCAMRTVGLLNFCVMITLSFGTVLTALFFPFLTITGVYVIFQGGGQLSLSPYYWFNHFIYANTCALLFFGVIAMILPARAALKTRSLHALLPYTWMLPFYYLLISCAAWCALVELIRAPFQWNKTTHGLARTSRTGRTKRLPLGG